VDALAALDDHELASVALGGSRVWILLEPSPGPLDERLDVAVEAVQARGFRALLAHPERHPAPDFADRLERLIGRGALVQMTAAYLTDEPTRPAMLALARAGLIHVLGSDAHSSRVGRRVELAPALEILAETEPMASRREWVAHTAPWGIVRGQDVVSPFRPAALD
jgi:tyrosine-protein phosphatase YwqE